MANEPIEKLYVSIEADIANLLLQTERGVKNVEKRLTEMERKGTKSFKNTGKEAKKMGVIIGAVAGVVQNLTNQLINMGRQVPRAFAAVIKATLDANKQFEKFSTQFQTLLGGTEAAQQRVAELVEFNIKTPFELPEIVEASRVLQIFGGTLLATGDNLQMVGDIAAGVNRPIEDVALWVGRAYDALQNGRPFGIAALALQRMGALSGEARAELERMQEQGIKGEQAWQRFTELVGTRFAGNMERLAETMVGIQSNLADFQTELLRLSGERLFENIKEDAQRLLDIMTAQREPLVKLGVGFGDVAAAMERMATSGILDQLEELDPAHLEDLAEAMGRFADAIERAGDKENQTGIETLIDTLSSLIDTITALLNIIHFFDNAMENAKDRIEEAGIVGEILVNTVEQLEMVFTSITNPLAGMIELVNQGTEAWRNLNDALEETLGFRLDTLSSDLAEATDKAVRGPTKPDLSAFSRGGAVEEPIIPDIPELEEEADEVMEILRDLTTDMLDEARDRQDALEALEDDHADRMTEINKAMADKISDINADLQRDLAKLAHDTAQERADIMRETQRDLEDLARDTDERLADERKDFNTDERRDTEDHLRDMRRLTEQYLFDLEDAVKERDARAVVDLQRRFAMESQRRDEDFTVNQQREREDFSVRLHEIRENEARRREEILRSQAEALADLVRNEAERRAEIERSHAEQIAKAQANAAKLRAKEQQNYAERQADLNQALDERLASVARELADEEKINSDGARRILGALSRYFGRGGEIDKLMNDFERRRRQRMIVEVSFEASARETQTSLGQTLPPGPYGRIPRFQHGGTLIARKPTLAMFGEAGPEMARFTPLGQGGGAPQKLQIEFSGSAPPGIRATERDQIAQVLLSALQDTGMLSR